MLINATLCYIKKNTQTLMLHRVKKKNDVHEGKWNGLGGKFEPGETPDECVIREIKEECGLDIKNPGLKGILTFPDFENGNDWTVFVYTVNEFSGELIKSNEGDLKWIDNSRLLSLNLWAGDKLFLKWIQENRFFSAKFIYKNGELTDHSTVFYKI
ncbi:8-oxo-dGTP diphosphatase [bacterium]|nr:8-oxo-dGTP diphosphatase [bacterium]